MAEKKDVVVSGTCSSLNPVHTHATGGRYTLIALSCLASAFGLLLIADAICQSNRLKAQELELQKQELHVRQQQYTLDSLRYYAPTKIK